MKNGQIDLSKGEKEWQRLFDEVDGVDMVIMVGVTGSGKSYVAKKIAKEVGAELIASDSIREEIFNSPRFDRAGDDVIHEMAKDYYPMMYDRAMEIVSQGSVVVVDATNLKRDRSDIWRKIKQNKKISSVIVIVRADRKKMNERMKKKKGKATENETYHEAWLRVVGYHDEHLETGKYSWPSEKDGFRVIEVWNN